MKKTNKKGFTIVELVIVIAVIAILAAVLIPTFISLTKKANQSADVQAVNQMNKALAIYAAENEKPENIADVKIALSENGINADTLVPVTQGYAFYWNPTDNTIELVGEDKKSESGWLLLSSSTGYGVEPTTSVTNATTLKEAITESETKGTILVKLENDITVDTSVEAAEPNGNESANQKGIFCIGNGQSLILDLNGKTIKSTREVKTGTGTKADGTTYTYDIADYLFRVDKGGQLTVKNAKVETPYTPFCCIDGTLRLENVTVNNAKKAGVFVLGLSDVTIVDSKIVVTNGFGIATNNSVEENTGARISVIRSHVETTAAKHAAIDITIRSNIIIEDSEVVGMLQGAYLRGCNATISTFTHKNAEGATTWRSGNCGPAADLILACGGDGSFKEYTKNVTINCNNVTASTVIVHEPEGGHVSVTGTGITITHTCHLEFAEKDKGPACPGNDTCGKTN